MKKIMLTILTLTILVGCSNEFQKRFTETSIGTYAGKFDDVSKFSNVYEMWKNNIDTIYIQAGKDDYTDTYLLERMPEVYATVINSMNEYDMKAYALLDSDVWIKSDKQAFSELWNILNYNSKYEDKRFKGVNINPNLNNIAEEEIKVLYANIEKARELIDSHNDSKDDNLTLSVNVNREIVSRSHFLELAKYIDTIIYEKNDSNEDIESVITMIGNSSEFVLNVDSNEDLFDSASSLIKLNNELKILDEYESFTGLVVSNYNDYHEFLKQKRP